ncbi:MAG: ABC transporter ATP-binding protein [Alphaproteobacteria bacterium]
MEVKITGLRKTFASHDGDVDALKNLSFDVKPGEFYTLLGPSGCGKSTTLRCIAGLEHPNEGEIRIGDRVVSGPGISIPTNQRPISMVFQSYAIWPHMTVFKNVVFPLKQRKSGVPKAERADRVMEALAMVKMEDLAHRPAPYLSGGQQQRVALARALVSRPEVLLLDEPLSNLDAKLREDLRIEIMDLTRRLNITTLYVTHDQLEALAMSDRIAVMLNGKILQEAAPRELYLKPANPFVAQFVGQVNFFDGAVAENGGAGPGVIETPEGRFHCPIPATMAKGAKARLAVRPESMKASPQRGDGGGNMLEGEVEKAVFLGDSIDCQIVVGTRTVRARVDQTMEINKGDKVFLRFSPEACVVLPPETKY